jgi:ABC-type transport system substrate-binding protein
LLDGIVFNYAMNFVTQRFKFEAGELDIARDLNQADLARYLTDERWKPFGAFEPPMSVHGEAMNTELAPFDNVEVRRAVAAAIDREQYRKLRPGTVMSSGRSVPPGIPGYSEAIEGQTYDLAAALEHMRRAGYAYDPTTGEGGYPYPVEYLNYKEGYSFFASQVLQQQLARIGIRIKIRLASFGTYLSLSQRRKSVQMSPQGWTQDYPEALDFYDALFASSSIAEDNSTNCSFFKNAELDGVIERARAELDPVSRQKLYDRAQEIVRDEAPWAFTHAYRWYRIRQPYVKDVAVHPTWVFGLNKAWFDRGKTALARRAGVFGELLGLRSPP